MTMCLSSWTRWRFLDRNRCWYLDRSSFDIKIFRAVIVYYRKHLHKFQKTKFNSQNAVWWWINGSLWTRGSKEGSKITTHQIDGRLSISSILWWHHYSMLYPFSLCTFLWVELCLPVSEYRSFAVNHKCNITYGTYAKIDRLLYMLIVISDFFYMHFTEWIQRYLVSSIC